MGPAGRRRRRAVQVSPLAFCSENFWAQAMDFSQSERLQTWPAAQWSAAPRVALRRGAEEREVARPGREQSPQRPGPALSACLDCGWRSCSRRPQGVTVPESWGQGQGTPPTFPQAAGPSEALVLVGPSPLCRLLLAADPAGLRSPDPAGLLSWGWRLRTWRPAGGQLL
jgi:hypothetical protein